MAKLAVIGASGHGKVVADIAESSGWSEIFFFDDAKNLKDFNGKWPIIGDSSDLLASLLKYDGVIVAIGNNVARHKVCNILLGRGVEFTTVIHPSAIVSQYAKVGAGTVIAAGVIINAYATIGINTIINTGASIDHDCVIGNYVHVSPGAFLAGDVKVGDGSWIGIGSCVRQQIKIGSRVTVGAGAVVVNDIADDLTVVGVPARPLR